MTTLTVVEQERLAELEQAIERGLKTFVEVGSALAEVRDAGLYLRSHKTFEDYCRERWNLSRPRAYALIDAADLAGAMSSIGDTPIPANEGQARELTGLPPETAAEVMRAAHAATDGKPTAKAISEARQQIAPKPPQTPPGERPPAQEQVEDAGGTAGEAPSPAPRPAGPTEPDPIEEAVAEFPDLTWYAERGRDRDVLRLAANLRAFTERELPERLDTLRKSIALEVRKEAEPPREPDTDHYALAGQIFDACLKASKVLKANGGAEAVRAGLDEALQVEVDLWRAQFSELADDCRDLARACKPALRSVK